MTRPDLPWAVAAAAGASGLPKRAQQPVDYREYPKCRSLVALRNTFAAPYTSGLFRDSRSSVFSVRFRN